MEHAERLHAEGWVVAFLPRINGTESGADILAARAGEIVLDQVKSTKSGPFASHGPAKRDAHRRAAFRAGGADRLVWAPFDRKPPRIIKESAWPDSKTH